MAAELLLWHGFLHDPRRHSVCWPESSWRLLKAFIAQPFLCSQLQLESNNNFTVCDQIVSDVIADIKGGMDTFIPFACLWAWSFVSSHLHLKGGGLGRTW